VIAAGGLRQLAEQATSSESRGVIWAPAMTIDQFKAAFFPKNGEIKALYKSSKSPSRAISEYP